MIEHKYRAWDKEYSHMYHTAWPFEHMVYVEMPAHDDQCNPLPINGNKFYNMNGKTFYFLMQKHVELMQYTGIKDKNGKEGYKDDLFKMFDRSLFQIIWSDDYARFQLKLVKGEELVKTYSMDMLQFCDIVGNIHENPELLEG